MELKTSFSNKKQAFFINLNQFEFNLSIPFIAKQSVKFSRKISALLTDKFDIDINFVYTTTKAGSSFRVKSRTPKPLMSCVVYEFRFLVDQTATYVGMSERNMALRVADHLRKRSKTVVDVYKIMSSLSKHQLIHRTLQDSQKVQIWKKI